MKHIVVLGGGFIGQLVQLAVPAARILDWRKEPPRHHLDTRIGPQYLWQPIPGVPSSSFPVVTLVDGKEPTPESIVAYKRKIGKEHDGGDWGLQFQHETTGWASELPPPFIHFGCHVESVDLDAHTFTLKGRAEPVVYDMLVSTIPLPALIRLTVNPNLHVPIPFRSDPIYMQESSPLYEVDGGMHLNYISDPARSAYRITTTAETQFVESLYPEVGARKLLPGKIHSHPEQERLLAMFRSMDVHCFGRFATWSPDELAHETWHAIDRWKTEQHL